MFAFVRRDPGEFVETGDFAGNLCRQIAGVKARDPPHSTRPGKYRVTKLVITDAVGADRAHACNHNPFLHVIRLSSEAVVGRLPLDAINSLPSA